jgi:hypothetical protein
MINSTYTLDEELDGPAVNALRFAIAEVKQRWSVFGWVTKNYYLELLRASEGTLSRWSRLHLQSLAPTNPHWAHVVMGRSSFNNMDSIKKACASALGT